MLFPTLPIGIRKLLEEIFATLPFQLCIDCWGIEKIYFAIENAGWEIVDVEAWRIHYAKTLRHWLANLDRVIDRAASLIGERKLLLWRIYLLGCALSFERNKIGIYQTLLRRKADWEWNLPLTRTGWLC